jgi:hypothetical protein
LSLPRGRTSRSFGGPSWSRGRTSSSLARTSCDSAVDAILCASPPLLIATPRHHSQTVLTQQTTGRAGRPGTPSLAPDSASSRPPKTTKSPPGAKGRQGILAVRRWLAAQNSLARPPQGSQLSARSHNLRGTRWGRIIYPLITAVKATGMWKTLQRHPPHKPPCCPAPNQKPARQARHNSSGFAPWVEHATY